MRLMRLVAVIATVASSLAAQSLRASPIMGALVQNWHYDATKQEITLTVTNTTKKDITAVDFAITVTHPDGTRSSFNHGFEMWTGSLTGERGFAAGTTRAFQVPQLHPIVDYKAVPDVVIYADNTADVLDEQMFQWFVRSRKGYILGLQKANELIDEALADPKTEHPSATVAAELKALHQAIKNNKPDDPERYEGSALLDAAQNVTNIARSSADEITKNNQLRRLETTHENRISILSAHTEVTEVQP
jgi:hypothetical protein